MDADDSVGGEAAGAGDGKDFAVGGVAMGRWAVAAVKMGFFDEGERVVAVAEGDAEGVGEGGEEAVANEAVVGFVGG